MEKSTGLRQRSVFLSSVLPRVTSKPSSHLSLTTAVQIQDSLCAYFQDVLNKAFIFLSASPFPREKHKKWDTEDGLTWLCPLPSSVLLWCHSYLLELCTVTLSWPYMGALVMVVCSFYHCCVCVPLVALRQVEASHAMAMQCQYGACGLQKASVQSLMWALKW